MSTESNKLTLAAKLARIGKEIGAVGKSGRNSQQNYDYIEYGVVAGRIRELFDAYSIIIIPSVDDYHIDQITNKYGNTGYHYTLRMSFQLINGDDKDDCMSATWLGESADYGDKGVNKAETSGTKYFLMRLFNVSEKGEEEADSKTPEIAETKAVEYKPAETNRINFAEVRDKITEITSLDELTKYWESLHLTEAQTKVLKTDFSAKKIKLTLENK